VVVTGGAVVEVSVVLVVGGTSEAQAPKPTDSAMTAARATFFRNFMVDYLRRVLRLLRESKLPVPRCSIEDPLLGKVAIPGMPVNFQMLGPGRFYRPIFLFRKMQLRNRV
jgi:hypothetical protein